MVAVVSFLVIVAASLLVTRVATVMLTLTGLSHESARFQARSAFTGTGFATSESELVVDHPVRRRIVMALMLLGSAGIVTGLATLLLSFNTVTSGSNAALRLAIILGFLFVLNRLAASRAADRALSRVIEWALRRFTHLDVRDYADLLHLTDHWVVGEIVVEPDDWFCGRTIGDLKLRDEGVLVLGIERAGRRYVGAPNSAARFHEGDKVVMYGQRNTLARVDARQPTAEGELDWVSSQIDFTERYLEQQQVEQQHEGTEPPQEPDRPHLHAGEREDGPDRPSEDP